MLTFFQNLLRHTITLVTSFLAFGFAADSQDSSLLMLGVFFGSYVIVNFSIKQLQLFNRRRKTSLTRKEFKHVNAQLKIAKTKIKALNSAYLKVRSINSFKQLHEMTSVAKNIVRLVRQNPEKFFAAERFFYGHLDSAVQLTEKYSFLSRQQVRDKEITIALSETHATLDDLTETLKLDLKDVLANDIEHLNSELDYIKYSSEKRKKQLQWRGDED